MSTRPTIDRKFTLLLATTITITCLAPSVFAERPQLEEVTVTAQKRSQSANDIPMSISTYTGEHMGKLGVQDASDIAALVPGMSFTNSYAGTPIYTLRGVGFNETSPQATSSVGIYSDEHAVPYPIMTRGLMLDVERVEVLKGPQGTLYGQNTTAGAINTITAKPGEAFEAGVLASYGNYQTATGEAYVSGPLTDFIGARLAAKFINSTEGWQESVSRSDKLGEQDKLAVRLHLAFDLGERADALLTTRYWKDKSDTLAPQFQDAIYPNPGPVADLIRPHEPAPGAIGNDATEAEWTAGKTPAFDMESLSIGLTFHYPLTDQLRLVSVTSYADFDDKGSTYERAGIAGTPPSAATAPYQNGDIAGQTNGVLTNDYSTIESDIDTFSQELRLHGETAIASWVSGVYYSQDDVDNVANQRFNLTTSTNGLLAQAGADQSWGNFPAIDNYGKQDTTTYAIFASADWALTDSFTLTTGLRYTDSQIDFKGCTADTGDGATSDFFTRLTAVVAGPGLPVTTGPGACVTWDLPTPQSPIGPSGEIERDLDEDSWSWRLALNYELSDDVSLYSAYSRGFKAGSFPTFGASNSNQFEPVVQEQVDAYEAGIKSSLAGGAARINASVFYYDYTDKQLLTKIADPVFGRLFALENVDDSQVWGAEVDAQWLVVEGLTLTANASYVETEIGNFIGSNQLGQEIDFDGSELPFSPNLQANAAAQYQWDMAAGVMGSVAVDVNYTGSAQADYDGKGNTDTSGNPYQYDSRFDIDSYTLVGARAGIAATDGSWNTYLWGRNLSNEYYYTNVSQATDMLSRYPGMPRTYGITLEYHW